MWPGAGLELTVTVTGGISWALRDREARTERHRVRTKRFIGSPSGRNGEVIEDI